MAGVPLLSSTAKLVWCRLGGGAGGCAGARWWRRGGVLSCAGSLLAEVLRRRRGVCYCRGLVRATCMVLCRVKAFTDACRW
jgi:hypothetical protein